MNFAFTEEQQELRANARAFLAEASSSERVRAAMASELGYDPQVWKRIGRDELSENASCSGPRFFARRHCNSRQNPADDSQG